MNLSRSGSTSAVIDGLLYVFGGRGESSAQRSSNHHWLQSGERYDPLKNEWVKLTEMSVRRGMGCCAVVSTPEALLTRAKAAKKDAVPEENPGSGHGSEDSVGSEEE